MSRFVPSAVARHAVVVLCLFRCCAAAADAALPLPEITVTKAAVPPVIDGSMQPGEWTGAAAGTGFCHKRPPSDRLVPNQTVFFVTYDDTWLYVAMKNYRGADQSLLRKSAREPDDVRIVFDDANEVWVTPPAPFPTTYQSLFNAYPAVFDVRFMPSIGDIAKGWLARWEMASSETREYWIVEGRVPIRSFGVDRVEDGSTWRMLFTTDILFKKGGGFRRWGPWVTAGFKDIAGHPFVHFRENSAVVQMLDMEGLLNGEANFPVVVTGPVRGQSRVTVTVRLGAGTDAAPEDLVLEKTVTVADGSSEHVVLAGDLSTVTLPTVDVGGKALPHGCCTVTAVTDDGQTLYAQKVQFTVDGTRRVPPEKLDRSPYEAPFGVSAFHASLNRKVVATVDRFYMENRESVSGGTARLIDDETGREVASGSLLPFRRDYAMVVLDLGGLELPVESDAAWMAREAVRKDNAFIDSLNKARVDKAQDAIALKPEPGPFPKAFTLETVLTAADGGEIARATNRLPLMDRTFEWQNNALGESDDVIPPWTPLAWADERLSMWNKTYRLNALGLAEEVVNAGAPQLSGAMQLVVTVDGEESVMSAGLPRVDKLTDATAQLSGRAAWGDLEIRTETRAEFDGFVLNRMTLAPAKPVTLDRLTLVVTMPASEAPVFVAPPGDMHATAGPTPERWSSLPMASGTRVGSFIPYVFLTDSDRGFCWFADNDRGWVIDPEGDALTIDRAGDQVVFRVNFVQRRTTLEAPTTIEYGWMVTPIKPQPAGWRACSFDYGLSHPHQRSVFLAHYDRRVVWHYYGSPYPKDMDKSHREILETGRTRGVVRCVGKTGDSLGWWQDYKGRDFSVLAADWALVPGELGDGKVSRGKGPNDYELWHWDRWIRIGELPAVYFDCNRMMEDYNFLGGTAYLLPDGRVQHGYSYLGEREYFKRLRYLFHRHGYTFPVIFMHTTAGRPIYAWSGDYSWEGENVQISSRASDVIDNYPVERFLALGRGTQMGAVPIFVCGRGEMGTEDFPFINHQLVGWMALHDTVEGNVIWHELVAENELWLPEVGFAAHWKADQPVASKTKDVLASAHMRPGHALVWVMNTSRSDVNADVAVDLKRLGLTRSARAFDAETAEPYALRRGVLRVPVPARLWRAVRLESAPREPGLTFVASFDGGEAVADYARGHRYAVVRDKRGMVPGTCRAYDRGASGLGLGLDTAYTFWTRHHLARDAGRIAWKLQINEATEGNVMALDAGWPAPYGMGSLALKLAKNELILAAQMIRPADPSGKETYRVESRSLAAVAAPAGSGWHDVALAWEGRDLRLTMDGSDVCALELPTPMPIPPPQHGIERLTQEQRMSRWRRQAVTFGPVVGAAVDDLRMSVPE